MSPECNQMCQNLQRVAKEIEKYQIQRSCLLGIFLERETETSTMCEKHGHTRVCKSAKSAYHPIATNFLRLGAMSFRMRIKSYLLTIEFNFRMIHKQCYKQFLL